MGSQPAHLPATLDGFEAARRFLASCFDDRTPQVETLHVVHLDRCSRCVHLATYPGGHVSIALPVRSILSDVLRFETRALILAHNHPGGEATPSPADCRATRILADALKAIGVTLVDHLVFATSDECHSMRRLGLV
jgi:DNA repair protein RadC